MKSPVTLYLLACMLAALAALAACSTNKTPISVAATVAPAAHDTFTLEIDEATKLGLQTQPAVSTEYRQEIEGYGLVWSHELIAQAVSDVSMAEAAARQSAASLARLRELTGTPGAFPMEAIESAQRQGSSDTAALLLAQRKLSARLGDHAPWKSSGSALSDLASGRTKLVRVTFPLGVAPHRTPRMLRLLPLNPGTTDKGWRSDAVWDAPADSAVPGHSVFVSARGEGLLEGDRLIARAPDGAVLSGVLVPESAVIVSEDKYWCFVEKTTGTFQHIRIDTRRPVDAGYVVTEGVVAGDSIVVRGAGLLLARLMGAGAESDE